MDEVPEHCTVEAWRPDVPGVSEVFHAHIVNYRYPLHCHDTWTVLIVEDGAIRFGLDKRERSAEGSTVALIPPGVVHDGQPAPGARRGFWKRNLYLDSTFLPNRLVGRAVEQTNLEDHGLRSVIASLHDALVAGEDPIHAEERLAVISRSIIAHLDAGTPVQRSDPLLAVKLRELLDEHAYERFTLEEAGLALGRSVAHLVHSFTVAFGMSPHAYVISRRVEAARNRLLDGHRPADVAVAVGFYDQAHLTRHFKRHTSVTPAKYATSHT